MEIIPHWIDGKKIIVPDSQQLNIFDPVNGCVAKQINVGDQSIVDRAVAAAKSAFITWSTTTSAQRAAVLFRYKALLDQHTEKLATIINQEHGKTIPEAIGSIQRGIAVVDFACGISNHLKGNFSSEVTKGIDCYSMHQALGVCVGITPFNFPAMIPLWMFPLAIACGNTFVLKPSEKDPSCSILLAELAQEAGVPDGVLNVIQGDKETVDALLKHPDVNAVSFVGSTPVAEYVYKTAIAHNKRAQAFGGAKNHCVVMPDADLPETADAIVTSAFGSAGERCMAISAVVIVGNTLADKLIAEIKSRVEKFKIGPGNEEHINMGPLVTEAHWQRVKSYIELGKQEGAQLIVDGSDYKPDAYQNGFFMGCSVFDHVKPHMRIYREEIFGPVLIILRVPDFKTALQLINEHEYGNGTAIFTRDGYIARIFAEKVQVGMVGINIPIPVPVAQYSFGGWKHSIFADLGMFGADAIRFYTKLKTVTERWFAEK